MSDRIQAYRLRRYHWAFIACAGVFGVAVMALLPSLRAATNTLPVEAEAGQLAGGASMVADDAASGGQAVRFAVSVNPSTPPPATGGCAAQPGKQLQDQDMSDSQLPWKRNGAAKVAIYFETKNMTQEYIGHMQKGVTAWAKSACLDPKLVNSCPAGVNCVTSSLNASSDEADGNFDAVEKNGYTTGGHITLYTKPLNKLGSGAKLNVTIHEMGHAVGLRHRKTERVLMNGDTYTDVFDPDQIDFQNLLVLYGNQQ